MERRNLTFPTALLAIALAPALLTAQQTAPDKRADQGRKLFQKSCAACHGQNAKGGRAPDLTTGQWRFGSTDEDIARNILSGIPGTQMPAFPIQPDEAQTIVAHLRALQDG